MTKPILFAALATLSAMATPQLFAQVPPAPAVASVEPLDSPVFSTSKDASGAATLPDAPSAVATTPADFSFAETPQSTPPEKTSGIKGVQGKYSTLIMPGETTAPLRGKDWFIYGLNDSFNLYALAGVTASAGYSHLVDSSPHFGTNATAFGKREGASALRNTIQTMTTDVVFAPMFHVDPRYYVMGDGHRFIDRVVYAASRVVVTRSSTSNKARFNAPLILAYGVTAASNNAYYPDRDRGAKETFTNWGTSLFGAVLGLEVNEFLNDALRIAHIRKH